MRIHAYCSDPAHPVIPHLRKWVAAMSPPHETALITRTEDAAGGDVLFLVSASQIVQRDVRSRYRAAVVLHASALPRGRGWSPVVWQILEGAREITVTALSAEDRVDTGPIWAQRSFAVEAHELVDEIHAKLFAVELALMSDVVARFEAIVPRPQAAEGATYYRRRTPEDSRIDPHRSVAEQFDLLRVCDPERYPAFFELHGHRYRIRVDRLA
jgi:methionyl-tRNA formyltransferase